MSPLSLWLDLANSPQVLFFLPLIRHWTAQGHQLTISSRPYAQTVELADQSGLNHTPVGGHGGRKLWRIGGALLSRSMDLRAWARDRRFDLAVSHNSYSQLLAARALGIPAVTTMDYEYQRANHLAFRLARRVVVPESFPEPLLKRYGAGRRAVRYHGLKEQVTLAEFTAEPGFRRAHGIADDRILAVVRPPADWALYHRFENPLISDLLERLRAFDDVVIVFLPRIPAQAEPVRALGDPRIHIPDRVMNGPQLLAAADMVFSAGGTMVREAAVLGTPAWSLFAGTSPAVDRLLVQQGRLTILGDRDAVNAVVPIRKVVRGDLLARGREVRDEVSTLLLEPLP